MAVGQMRENGKCWLAKYAILVNIDKVDRRACFHDVWSMTIITAYLIVLNIHVG